MIYESMYWKKPLLESASWLNRIKISERIQERTYVRLEKELFVSFYSVRKLIEAKKVSDEVANREYNLEAHPNYSPVNRLNWHDLDELYDLDNKSTVQKTTIFICNQFIHSYVFDIYEENGKFGGVLISSDRERNKCLYRISKKTMVSLLRDVGKNYPRSVTYKYDIKQEEYDVSFNEF
jgi:hypothetical protein